MDLRKLIRRTILAESKSGTLKVYRGGFNGKPPVFWTTDIAVAKAFYNESRFIADIGYKKVVISLQDAETIQRAMEPVEDLQWALDWDLMSEPMYYEHLKFDTEYLFGARPKKLIITENPKVQLLEGVATFKNPMVLDFKGKVWGESNAVIEFHFEEARKNGNDAVIVNNIIEGGLVRQIGNTPSTTFVDMTGKCVSSIKILNPHNYADINYD